MQSDKKINTSRMKRILKKYPELFLALQEYDKTRELSFQRKKIYLTLSVETINKLKALREKTGKPISRLIEEKMS